MFDARNTEQNGFNVFQFYNDLTLLLTKFQTKVHEFCAARQQEKEELTKDVSANAGRQPLSPTSAIPTYQQSHPLHAPTFTMSPSKFMFQER